MKKAVFSNSFLKDLNKLEKQIKDRIKVSIKQLILDSEFGIPLRGNLKPHWKLRVGKYRIIYRFDKNSVYFIAIDLRKRVYK